MRDYIVIDNTKSKDNCTVCITDSLMQVKEFARETVANKIKPLIGTEDERIRDLRKDFKYIQTELIREVSKIVKELDTVDTGEITTPCGYITVKVRNYGL